MTGSPVGTLGAAEFTDGRQLFLAYLISQSSGNPILKVYRDGRNFRTQPE